jgi:hypothetical protein
MDLAVSTTRASIFKMRSRSVVNTAGPIPRLWECSRTVSISLAAQTRNADGASRADIVGDLVDLLGQRIGSGQTEDLVNVIATI